MSRRFYLYTALLALHLCQQRYHEGSTSPKNNPVVTQYKFVSVLGYILMDATS